MADLATTAPSTLAPDVLVEVGLADRYGPPGLADRAAVRGLERPRVSARSSPPTMSLRGHARPGPADRSYRADALPPDARAGDRPPARPATGACASTSTCAATATSSATSGARRSRSRAARSGPYGWIAAEIGRPKAVRAVGTALGHNPVPLIVPVPPRRPDGRDDRPVLARRARRTSGRSSPPRASTPTPSRPRPGAASALRRLLDTTDIVCLADLPHARRHHADRAPTCRSGRSPMPPRPGYRPCKVCRPASGPSRWPPDGPAGRGSVVLLD